MAAPATGVPIVEDVLPGGPSEISGLRGAPPTHIRMEDVFARTAQQLSPAETPQPSTAPLGGAGGQRTECAASELTTQTETMGLPVASSRASGHVLGLVDEAADGVVSPLRQFRFTSVYDSTAGKMLVSPVTAF
eukprot:gene7794-9261_t